MHQVQNIFPTPCPRQDFFPSNLLAVCTPPPINKTKWTVPIVLTLIGGFGKNYSEINFDEVRVKLGEILPNFLIFFCLARKNTKNSLIQNKIYSSPFSYIKTVVA